MQWIAPVSILLFLFALQVTLDRYYARWSLSMAEMERRDAEFVEKLRKQREGRASP